MKHIKIKPIFLLMLFSLLASSLNVICNSADAGSPGFGWGLTVHAEEQETAVFTIPIYHKHTGSSAGGGCYGALKSRVETQEIFCDGKIVYYPSTDTSGCAKCGAGYHGDQSFRSCWLSEVIENVVSYYDINCGKSGVQTGTVTLEKSTDQWTKELELIAHVDNYGDIRLTDTPFIWNGTPTAENVYKVTENGTYTLKLQADANTNTEGSILSVDITNIDHTAPIMDEPAFSCTEWTSENVILTLANVQDLQPDGSAGCGLAENPYSYDQGVTYTNEAFWEIEQSGTYIIRLKDALGNEGEYLVTVSNIDKQGPTFTLLDYSKEENIRENLITVEAVDYQPDGSVGCGLAELPFSFDEGKTWEANNQWSVTQNGTYPVWVKDALGNITVTEVVIDNIDTYGPKVSYSLDPSSWTNRSVQIHFYVEDVQPKGTPGIGLPAAFISWDEGKTWESRITAYYGENQNVTVWCKDSYGNITVCVGEISNIDCSNPWMEAWADTDKLGEGESTWIHVNAKDYESGLADRPFSFDGGISWTDTPEWEVTEPGNYPVFVIDKVGNLEYRYVTIESKMPEIPAIEPEEPPTVHPIEEVEETETTEETVKMPVLTRGVKEQPVITITQDPPFWKDGSFVIIVAAGSILLLAAIAFLLYYFLYGTVRIYNLQEEEQYEYLGRVWIGRKEGEHFLYISQELIDQSYTTSYKILPGSLFAELQKQEKLWLDFGHNYETFTLIDREILAKNHVATSIKL